jgi:hypothetical protein
MKHEWRKHEKQFYAPKAKPEYIEVPSFKYFVIEGEGNPNSEAFAEKVGLLYALSYAIRMSPKKNRAPKNYFEYTVYPLEGIWDLNEKGRADYDGSFDKNNLVYRIMIRQPDFVTEAYAQEVISWLKKEKPNDLLNQVSFEAIADGPSVQMLHQGSFDSEPASFEKMQAFTEDQNWKRLSLRHREVYLNDARKTAPEKLKTILRFKVKK